MIYQFLAATGGRPAISFVDTASRERLPLPVGVDDAYAFDQALGRNGWVVVAVGQQVAALRDDNLLAPVRLPDCWQIFPSPDPMMVVVTRFLGDSRRPGEPMIVSEVDETGAIRREASIDSRQVHGVLLDGRVVGDAIFDWDGTRHPIPGDGWITATVGNRLVMGNNTGRWWTADVGTGAEIELPNDRDRMWFLPEPASDLCSVVLHHFDYDAQSTGVLLIRDDGSYFSTHVHGIRRTCRTSDGKVLLSSDDHLLLDPGTGAMERIDLPRGCAPRVDVTGRFDIDSLRRVLAPRWQGPIPARERDAILDRQRAELGTVDDIAVGARLRPVLGRRPATASSHLGGRPALPRGTPWPRYDDTPMAFIGQIRGDEVSAAIQGTDLGEVLISLFVGLVSDGMYPAEPDAVTVLVLPCTGLSMAPWPRDLDDALRFEIAALSVEPVATLPGQRDAGGHQLFGHAQFIQDHSVPDGFALLAQIDSDAMTGWAFGDGGRLHIWSAIADGIIHVGSSGVTLDSY